MSHGMVVYLCVSLFFAIALVVGLCIHYAKQDEMIDLLRRINNNVVDVETAVIDSAKDI